MKGNNHKKDISKNYFLYYSCINEKTREYKSSNIRDIQTKCNFKGKKTQIFILFCLL